MNESELVLALQKGDAKAQRILYDRYAGPMMGVCVRYLKNEMDAEEVLINGFMKVYQHVNKFEQKGSFEGWMRRIMVNEALQHLRKQEPLHLAIEKEHNYLASEDASADSDMSAGEMMELLLELPAGYRAVFNLYAIEGYSHKEIADMLQITEGTSKSQLSKARAMLQRLLARQGVLIAL
ncbi:RNA polymerase sigma factor [Rufibacter glacialis]|uniref:RNA polymerase sigma factor n=1 Tax=Rufibacter glacialis TaxID=1259555 RepID=A0A5M8QHH0_9BACT|nr:sigma-70 family RNA polymerase sigma factor [Rufibacter glacialis]KAA6434273.1 sigma-70 family RNA polymerase sigma factor [Rufibacter glacialis]GGK68204.1 DNA-directed RNA polymerase sigma-70 factor [Rufibacter glacialis]